MSASPCLQSPPSRPLPAGRVQTRSGGSAASSCPLCSPPARGGVPSSPFDGDVPAVEDPVALIVENWCSPTLKSPEGRWCSPMQLQQHQASEPVRLGDAFLEDKQWDMEAMVLATIAGQLEDEEEEEEEEIRDECGECEEEDPISGWALDYRGAAHCGESPCESDRLSAISRASFGFPKGCGPWAFASLQGKSTRYPFHIGKT